MSIAVARLPLRPELSSEELERYDRQIRMFGRDAQLKLKKASVLVVGVGGLGSPASIYLAAAGIGRLVLLDFQKVELSNLNRQVAHWTTDIGRLKVESAAEKIRKLNPEVDVETLAERLDESNVRDIVNSVDIVVDGLDNWASRFLVNRVCVELGKPFVHAGVKGMHGQLTVVYSGKGPCLQCIIPKPPPEKKAFPVLGTTPGVMGVLEANEVIKLVTGYGRPLIGRLLIYDGLNAEISIVRIKKRENCPVCGLRGC